MANQRITIATDINNIANQVDSFELKCPDGFIQQDTSCYSLTERPQINENFENTKKSNSIILLLILILLVVLAYRNKDFVKKTFNINL